MGHVIRGNILQYYSPLEYKLANTFHMNISLVPVSSDGNCLNRELHLFFGTESRHEILKHQLIATIRTSIQQFPNVLQKLGISSEAELDEHIVRVSPNYAWGTDVELRILGALAGIEVISVNATDSDCTRWRREPVYIYYTLTSPAAVFFPCGILWESVLE